MHVILFKNLMSHSKCSIYGCSLTVILAVLGLHCFAWAFLGGQVGATLHCCAQASHCGGFSCCDALALGHAGFMGARARTL